MKADNDRAAEQQNAADTDLNQKWNVCHRMTKVVKRTWEEKMAGVLDMNEKLQLIINKKKTTNRNFIQWNS